MPDTTNAALAAKIRELHAQGSDGWADLSNLLEINAIVLAEALEVTAKLAALLHEYHGRMHGADHRCARVAGECEAQDAIDQYFKETP